MRATAAAVLLISTATFLLHAPSAHACGNSMREHQELHLVDHESYLRAAKQHFASGKDRRALKSAELAMKSREAGIQKEARKVGGLAALRMGRYQKAMVHLEKAAKLSGDMPVLLARLGEAEVGAGKYDVALARLQTLEEQGLLPDADAYVALGKARAHNGDVDGALKAVGQALEKNSAHKGALALKAKLEKKAPIKQKRDTKKPLTVGA